MNIISEKETKTRLLDGIETTLNLSEEEFRQVIEGLKNKKRMESLNFYYITDSCEIPERTIKIGLEDEMETRGYYTERRISMRSVIATVDRLKELITEEKQKQRAIQLIATRDLESFKELHSQGSEREKKILDRLFEMLGNQIAFEAFLDYENHKGLFAVEGQFVPRQEYLKYLGEFFGMKKVSGNLEHDNEISMDFYIPKLEEYKRRYAELFDKVNMDRYANPAYRFEFRWLNPECDRVIRKGEEPEWQVSKSLQQAIVGNMPDNLTLEEQAMYIYCKMLEQFSYDTGYFYRDYLGVDSYSHVFSKQHLESLEPGAKITCWDFARIFSKLVNELEGDIEAVILSQGRDKGHFSTGFYTDRVSVTLEAINGRANGTNDIVKAKQGVQFEGIETISDREGLVPKALQKVYPLVFNKPQISIEEYISQLSNMQGQKGKEDIDLKLQAFAKTMKENRIFGNEATQLLKLYQKVGFFEEEIRVTYLGQMVKRANRQTFERIVAIRQAKNKENAYLLQTETLELVAMPIEEIKEKLRDGEWIYETSRQTIQNIDRGEKF